ncbi:MMPL family transporter [Dactylosporangium sp. NPDC050688]|uniref:MMPL family transporter n=1 Tax=Dactylosporangium sp. NPDC050688 TaxID=3157217 RepID=UPI00340FE54F
MVFAVWLVLIMVGGSLAADFGSVQNNETQTWLPADAESTKAIKIAESQFADKNIMVADVVYVRDSGLTDADLAAIDGDRTALAALAVGDISKVTVSGDGKAAFILVPLRSSQSDNTVLGDAVAKVRTEVEGGAPDGLDVRITGAAGNVADYIDVYSGMDATLLLVTLAVVAVFLLVIYRSPVLWLVPLLAVGLSSQVATGLVYLLGKHAGLLVNGQSSYVLTVLMLGVGTDYALLLIARYREELHRHEDRHEAMALALQRCLPAIAASAGTVIIATLCLVFGSMNSTRGLGPVVAIGVAVVFLAMTSLLPALLVIFGRWLFWPFAPRHAAGYEAADIEKDHGVWARFSAFVGRWPRLIWIATALVLVGLAFGTSAIKTGQTQAEQFTKTVDSVRGQELLGQHFPSGTSAPADVYVPSAAADTAAGIVRGVPGVTSVDTAGTAGGWTHLTAVLNDAPDTAAARQTVQRLRAALDGGPAEVRQAVVGGQSAVALDTSEAQWSEVKLLVPLILGVVLLMLVLLLRAIVAPVLLLVSVVLSYAAAVGTAALLFRALGHPNVDRGLFLFGFLFLVALGVDYTIFLMTRAREEVQRRGHRAGILTSLTVTGGVITSAGLVLAATFCVLAVIPTVQSLQQGVLVAVGVLLDTFLVRSLLIPALSLEVGPRIWLPGRPATEPAPPLPAQAGLRG